MSFCAMENGPDTGLSQAALGPVFTGLQDRANNLQIKAELAVCHMGLG